MDEKQSATNETVNVRLEAVTDVHAAFHAGELLGYRHAIIDIVALVVILYVIDLVTARLLGE